MTDCLFCKMSNNDIPVEKIHEDEFCFVINDLHPQAKVHLLVIPQTHVKSLDDITEKDDKLMTHMIRLLPDLAKKKGLKSGFKTVINTGAGGGQEIFHLHIHLLGNFVS
jgi:histidine triad (HIT) family protein